MTSPLLRGSFAAAAAALLFGVAVIGATPSTADAAPAQTAGCPGIAEDICDMGKFMLENGTGLGLAGQLAPEAADEGFEALAGGAFGAMAAEFGEAGVSLLKSLAESFAEASTIDLSAAGVDPVLAITMPIAMLVAVLLVLTAAGKAAVSGNGSVVATALVGLVKTALVTVLLVAVVQMALRATDALTAWIIDKSLGGNEGLEERLATLISLDPLGSSSALVLVFGLVAIVVAVVLWVELLFRQVAIVVLVAVAPIAATGQILGETSEWWSKTRNALIQLILLKPVIALCFAVGFSTLGGAGDLMGVLGGFVTLGLAALAWPLLAKFMTFATVGAGHGALSGLLGTGAGFLAGRKASSGSSASGSGPSAAAGAGYSTALEAQNDTAAAASAGSGGGTGRLAGFAGKGAKKAAAAPPAAGATVATGGVAAVVGAAATATSAAADHVEGQMTSAAAEAELGHPTRPGGTYGHTRGRFGGRPHLRHSGGRADSSDAAGGGATSIGEPAEAGPTNDAGSTAGDGSPPMPEPTGTEQPTEQSDDDVGDGKDGGRG